MKKELTIILTIHSPVIRELRNYKHSFETLSKFYKDKKIDNPIQFLILSDNPNLNKDIEQYIEENFLDIENFTYVPCEENLVRLGQIFRNMNLIEGRYIKAVDPDDYLIPEETFEFVENVVKKIESDNHIIIHPYRRTNSLGLYWETAMEIEHDTFYKNASFNPNSVYPTKILKEIDWDFKLLIWSDDLIGFMLKLKGAEIYEDRLSKFYLNSAHAGVSTTTGPHKNMRFYNDSLFFIKKASELINKDENKYSLFKILTEKPSKWLCKQIYIDLYWNKSINRYKKIKLLKNIYRLINNLSIEDNDLVKFQKRTIWSLLLNKKL